MASPTPSAASETLSPERREQLLERAQKWAEQDPDPETQAQLRAMIEAQDFTSLRDAVDGELEFGTAGLRAIVGPGPNKMNSAVIRRATKAVAEQLEATLANAKQHPVVLGADARLSSPKFLEDTASVFVAAGFSVRYFEGPVSTPLVAYAGRARCRASSGRGAGGAR
jgi:phosphomannomutase